MKIALLAQNPHLYSHLRLIEAAETRGHEIQRIKTLLVYLDVTPHHPAIHYKGEELTGFDAVIPRIGASITFYGLAVLRQFETMGIYALNSSSAISVSRDKLHCLQVLAKAGIGLPNTGYAHSTRYSGDLVNMASGAPVIIKLLEGTQGVGVILSETKRSAKSIIDAFRQVNVNILVQEFIKESEGEDIRCFVVGRKVIAAMKRSSGIKGDFRANVHRGGKAESIQITPEEKAIALKACKILGLNVAGVDLLRSERGPLVIEVNSSPGFEALEAATGVDVAIEIIKFLEDKMQKDKGRP